MKYLFIGGSHDGEWVEIPSHYVPGFPDFSRHGGPEGVEPYWAPDAPYQNMLALPIVEPDGYGHSMRTELYQAVPIVGNRQRFHVFIPHGSKINIVEALINGYPRKEHEH